MGAVVPALLSIAGSAVLGSGIKIVGTALTVKWGAVAIGASMIAGAMALAPKPKQSGLGSSAFAEQAKNRSQMVKQPIVTRETVYGKTKKSGNILFIDTTSNNQMLHLIVQIASHEIESFDKIYFDDEELTLTTISPNGTDANGFSRFNISSPSKYAKSQTIRTNRQNSGKVEIKLHKGEDTQLADADLVEESSKWTTSHRLSGIAYIYVSMEYDADMFPNGIPNVSAEISGKKILDFRTGSTAFSTNPALCIYDYLTDTKLGLSESTSALDTTSFTTMADLCDENVNLSAGGTEKRYTCNGIIYNNISHSEILENLLSSCAGILSHSNGKFILKGGQFTSPSITLTDDDFISNIALESKKSRKDLFNTVKGVFTSEETNWQPSDFPMVTSTTFSNADGELIFADIDLPFTISSVTAQRLAKIALFKNRQQIVLSAQIKMTGFRLEVGDTVNITNSRLGFTNKVFEVAEWSFVQDEILGIKILLNETSSDVYDWNAEENNFILDNTNLPSAQDVSPPSIVVTDTLRVYAETPITVLQVTVTSGFGSTNEFEVEAQNTNEAGSEFITLGRSKGNIFELVNAEDGSIYNIRARTINGFNVHSDFVTRTHEVLGKTAPPSDVTNFASNVVGDVVHLSWTPVTDLDLSHYIIRHNPLTTNQKFEEGLIVAEKIGKPANTIVLPAQTGTYMIKAIDVLGFESENSAKTVIIKNAISRNFNAVITSTQSPNFSEGTISDLEIVNRSSTNFLQLIEGIIFDDATGNFDDMTGLFDSGGTTTFNNEGFYDFPIFDLGGIFNSRVLFTCKFNRFNSSDALFDSTLGLFDSQTGNFEGNYTEHNDINVQLLIATSVDGVTYTEFRNYIVGDYKASHIKLRVKLECDTDTVTPAIYELSASVDMPDSVRAEDNVTSGTSSSGKVISFSPAFKELQGLGISAQSLQTGDFYELTSKSATGFTIKFKNSGGSIVSREFDYVAKGYGYVESA